MAGGLIMSGNPNTQMPKWLIYALIGKAVALVVIVAVVLYFVGAFK
jgi:hypothetical protein